MSLPEPAFDNEGYPTDATLVMIQHWPYKDFLLLMDFVRKAWRYPERFTEAIDEEGHIFILSTGGWSGNEDIIAALQQHRLFWATCWDMSRRGGHYGFKIPRRPEALAGMTGGSSPPTSEGGLQPPPPPTKD